jgi:hypothetical protein
VHADPEVRRRKVPREVRRRDVHQGARGLRADERPVPRGELLHQQALSARRGVRVLRLRQGPLPAGQVRTRPGLHRRELLRELRRQELPGRAALQPGPVRPTRPLPRQDLRLGPEVRARGRQARVQAGPVRGDGLRPRRLPRREVRRAPVRHHPLPRGAALPAERPGQGRLRARPRRAAAEAGQHAGERRRRLLVPDRIFGRRRGPAAAAARARPGVRRAAVAARRDRGRPARRLRPGPLHLRRAPTAAAPTGARTRSW